MSKLELTDKHGKVYLVEERCAEEKEGFKEWSLRRRQGGLYRIEIREDSNYKNHLAFHADEKDNLLCAGELRDMAAACIKGAEFIEGKS